MTEVESDEIREVRERLREQTGASTTADVSAEVLGVGDKPRTILSFPVKHGVTFWNVLAIPLVPICIMLLTTYVSA